MKADSKSFIGIAGILLFSGLLSTYWTVHAYAVDPAPAKVEAAAAQAPQVFGRAVPERKDDFAWENDRIAFRMYGPALEADGEISSGIDVWAKSTARLVINDWYRKGDYHNDHGEGVDFYKVGPSRGCGGLAVWHQGKMHPSKNWAAQEVLERGPDRLTFQLKYHPWDVGSRRFWETKTISLSAGSNLNRIESVLSSDRPDCLTVAVGIALRPGDDGISRMDPEKGLLMYWEPPNAEHGSIGCAVIVNPDHLVDMIEAEGHLLALVNTAANQPLVYYAGACWSKNLDFPNASTWEKYLREFVEKSTEF